MIVAALCNFAVGLLVYRYAKRAPRVTPPEDATPVVAPVALPTDRRGVALRFGSVLLLSGLVGYVALSQEILWFRLLSYATGGRPDVFAHVLGFMLIGIAYGARDTKKVAEGERGATLTFVAGMLTAAGLVYYIVIPLIGLLSTLSGQLGMGLAYAAVLVVAFLTGGILPALCHYGIEASEHVGLPLAWVYFANIVGATAGPLLTGFVLLEFCTLQQTILSVSVLTLVLAAAVWLFTPLARPTRLAAAGGLVLASALMVVGHGVVYANLLEKLHFKTEFAEKGQYREVIQNRSGIVAVESGDIPVVYGGGAFDGTFNVDPVRDSNGIRRAYMVAALHPDPREVLEIGLSSGSWARVVVGHPAVQSFTSVEINPAYHQLLAGHPETAGLLHDPKVTLHYDDARRWLRRNPDRKFDFILMNTPQHWRDHVTNLLSEEFLRLCQSHLKEGGMLYYNATESPDVPYTAAHVFRYVTRYSTFVAASDQPFTMTREDKRRTLLRYQQAGKPVFAPDDREAQAVLEGLAGSDTSDQAPEWRARRDCWRITDDNMAPEFKRRYEQLWKQWSAGPPASPGK